MRRINIEGKHIRWFVLGALTEYYKKVGVTVTDEQMQYGVSDTCNRVHKYLTTGGDQGAGGGASDIQCTICTELAAMFGWPKREDEVNVFW